MFEEVFGCQGDVFRRLVYPVTSGVVIGGEYPQDVVCVYGDGKYVGERDARDVQFLESMLPLRDAVEISVVFHDKEVVVVAFCHVVLVLEVGEALADLLFEIDPVESVVGLNPQNIFFGFHDAADHVAGQYRFGGVDGVVHVQAVAVEDVQSVARADPDGALVVLVEREDGAVGQSLFVGELSQAVCVGWV